MTPRLRVWPRPDIEPVGLVIAVAADQMGSTGVPAAATVVQASAPVVSLAEFTFESPLIHPAGGVYVFTAPVSSAGPQNDTTTLLDAVVVIGAPP